MSTSDMDVEHRWTETKQKLIADWHEAFKKGTDFDLWGQPLEAIDSYSRLAIFLQEAIQQDELFTEEEKKTMNKIKVCLELREKALQVPDRQEGMSLSDIRKIEKDLTNLFSRNSHEFPLDVGSYLPSPKCISGRNSTGDSFTEAVTQARADNLSEVLDDDEEVFPIGREAQGTLSPQLDPVSGQTVITIRIEKIGLKDPAQYIDPFLTISVRDGAGNIVLPPQDTPVSTSKQDNSISFNMDVHLQKTLQRLPPGFVVFFKFKHFKPKKQKTSTRCWACMEHDEIKEGSAVLELYKKPTDYKRKKISLLTVKPLYLHVKLIFNG